MPWAPPIAGAEIFAINLDSRLRSCYTCFHAFTGAAESGSCRGLREGANAEALLDWFAEGVASTASVLFSDRARDDTAAEVDN